MMAVMLLHSVMKSVMGASHREMRRRCVMGIKLL